MVLCIPPVGDAEGHRLRYARLDVEEHRAPVSPFQHRGLCVFIKSTVLSLGATPEVTSPWKHEHSGPHLSRSRSCPRSRKKHFLALVSLQGSLAPVSCFWSGRGILWWPLGQLVPCEGRACLSPPFQPQKPRCSGQPGARAGAWATEDGPLGCHSRDGKKHSPGIQRRRLCHPVAA